MDVENSNNSTVENENVEISKQDNSENIDNGKRKINEVESSTDNDNENKKDLKKIKKQTTRKPWAPKERKEGEVVEKRRPKKKCALLMGFCGTGYQGMQINPGAKTIEGDLWKALVEAKAISFVRAARTDKGVHAIGQVISGKFIIEDEDIVDKINAALPEQIRVWDIIRTSNSFHAKNAADSRIYEYLLPSYCLMPANPIYYPNSTIAKDLPNKEKYIKKVNNNEPVEIPPYTEEEIQNFRDFRISKEKLETFRKGLEMYIGSHNYHNFTVGKKFEEESSTRYIISFNCSEPFIRNGVEWLSLKIQGQAFMIHQIRKMIGFVVMLLRTGTTIDLISTAFTKIKMNIPKVPGDGLWLDQVVIQSYSKRFPNNRPITFEPYKDKIEPFREKYIYSKIIEEEHNTNCFIEWLKCVDSHSWEIQYFLNMDGDVKLDQRPDYLIQQEKQENGNKVDKSIENGEENTTNDDIF
ncbi:pseudouridine synthase [Anaeromyces robustus]|uniref:Pseudouridine synthase n=1 Tax=Anaeromyces robustus TaxID=1754192 RepID=A0A1Y1X722_9FUNG|nr:pseudouridine synthase [Anaeromyces robustus]|eukprot:ORX81561.1 pseudouridine synthase [Anaeromyces robustus]